MVRRKWDKLVLLVVAGAVVVLPETSEK